jgi:hypothetical protein
LGGTLHQHKLLSSTEATKKRQVGGIVLRIISLLLIALTIVFSVACRQATATPSTNSASTETAAVVTATGILPYPAATSVPSLPTSYPSPSDATQTIATALPLPTSTPYLPPSPIPPIIISQVNLNCTSQNSFAKCDDGTLKIEYEYPSVWGEIEAVLRVGGDSGFAYDYTFSAFSSEQNLTVIAGGRSKDFAEGRGGLRTDFKGYAGLSSQSRCDAIKEYIPICEEIKADVVLLMEFPKAHHICEVPPGTLYRPITIIEINLPANPTINGFVFISPFLSEQEEERLLADMRAILGYDPESGARTRCSDANQAQLDRRIGELVRRIENDEIDNETRENIAKLNHIAQSITFRR